MAVANEGYRLSDGAPQGVVVGGCAGEADAPRADPAVAPSRRRIRLGAISFDVRRFPRQRAVQLSIRANMAVLVLALEGRAELIGESIRTTVSEGQAILLARPGASTLVWSAGAEGVVIHWPRARIQMLASRHLDQPVRLAACDVAVPLPPDEILPRLVAAYVDDVEQAGILGDDRQYLWAGRLENAFIGLLTGHADCAAILPIARSIRRAIQHIRDNAETDVDAAALAAMSGVVPRTLREGFRTCLGISLAAFVQETRLKRARERLASGFDTRAMAEVSQAAGFRSASAFSRAYVRAFAETPSQTRARSARQGGVRRETE